MSAPVSSPYDQNYNDRNLLDSMGGLKRNPVPNDETEVFPELPSTGSDDEGEEDRYEWTKDEKGEVILDDNKTESQSEAELLMLEMTSSPVPSLKRKRSAEPEELEEEEEMITIKCRKRTYLRFMAALQEIDSSMKEVFGNCKVSLL